MHRKLQGLLPWQQSFPIAAARRREDVFDHRGGGGTGGLRLVVFSGGECFLLGEDLNRCISHCSSLGLMTRCVTNGFWAKSMTAGRKRLRGLCEAGLTELNVSAGDFRQEYVPEKAVINAAQLGVELGLSNTLIVVEARRDSRVTAKDLSQHVRLRALAEANPDNFKIVELPWMPMRVDQT